MNKPLTAVEELELGVPDRLDVEGIVTALTQGRLVLKRDVNDTVFKTRATKGKQGLPVSRGIQSTQRLVSPHGVFEWRETATTGEIFILGASLEWRVNQAKHASPGLSLTGPADTVAQTMAHLRQLDRDADGLRVAFAAMAHGRNIQTDLTALAEKQQKIQIQEEQRTWRAKGQRLRSGRPRSG
jgi:hypothetical protein